MNKEEEEKTTLKIKNGEIRFIVCAGMCWYFIYATLTFKKYWNKFDKRIMTLR